MGAPVPCDVTGNHPEKETSSYLVDDVRVDDVIFLELVSYASHRDLCLSAQKQKGFISSSNGGRGESWGKSGSEKRLEAQCPNPGYQVLKYREKGGKGKGRGYNGNG